MGGDTRAPLAHILHYQRAYVPSGAIMTYLTKKPQFDYSFLAMEQGELNQWLLKKLQEFFNMHYRQEDVPLFELLCVSDTLEEKVDIFALALWAQAQFTPRCNEGLPEQYSHLLADYDLQEIWQRKAVEAIEFAKIGLLRNAHITLFLNRSIGQLNVSCDTNVARLLYSRI